MNTPEDIEIPETAWLEAFAFLDANFAPDIELLGRLHMRTLSTEISFDSKGIAKIDRGEQKIRAHGEFYTPRWVVDHCVEIAWRATSKGQPEHILDPACGSGNFLLGALRHAKKNSLSAERLIQFATSALFGNDIDGCAVSVARFSLLIALSPELAQLQAEERANALATVFRAFEKHLSVADSLTPDLDLDLGEPDVLITNPPYISFGARNQAEMPAAWSRYLRQTYPASAEYKIRLHSIFQEIALQRVRDGGQVVLLVPDAFLNGAYYKKLRQQICSSADIVTLCELPEATFADAVVGRWCIAHYRKTAGAPERMQTKLERFHAPDENALPTCNYVDHADLVSPKDKFRFQLLFTDADVQLVRHLSNCARLADFASGHTGMRSRFGQKSIVSDSSLGSTWRRGLISGSSLRPHNVEYQGKWLNIDPANLFAGGFDSRIIESPKILMRQTADRIIAAVDTHHYYHLNNVHSFSANSAAVGDDWLYYAAGLMNSRFWLYLYQLKSREQHRALAQIDIEMIESMPVPDAGQASISEIASLVKAVMSTRSGEPTALQKIDSLVYELYELPHIVRRHIEEHISPLTVAAPTRT